MCFEIKYFSFFYLIQILSIFQQWIRTNGNQKLQPNKGLAYISNRQSVLKFLRTHRPAMTKALNSLLMVVKFWSLDAPSLAMERDDDLLLSQASLRRFRAAGGGGWGGVKAWMSLIYSSWSWSTVPVAVSSLWSFDISSGFQGCGWYKE